MSHHAKLKTDRVPVNEEESKKPEYKKFGDTPKRYQVKKNSKFDYSFVEPIARMVAAGLPDDFIAYTLNVATSTFYDWKTIYPQVAAAYKEAKNIATKNLIARAYRCAAGYDYEDRNEKWTEDEDGNRTGKKQISVFHKHEPPNPQLLMFILCNRDKENWHSKHKLEIDNSKNLTIKIDGKIASKQIEEFYGKLLESPKKKVECKEIENS